MTGPETALTGLETALAALVAAQHAEVSVAFLDLGTGAALELDARKRMHAASTMKLPVLIAAHRLAQEGALRLSQPVLVGNRFRSLADGSSFSTDPKDDDDAWTYAQLGRRVPLSSLLERMIVRSGNLATNLVLELVPPRAVTVTCRALGAVDLEVLRGVEDGRAHALGLDNTVTARDLAVLLAAVARSAAGATGPLSVGYPVHAEVAGAAAILALLRRQELNDGIPEGLPPGTAVAHKTGSITAHCHDAALVFPEGRAPYVLVVLTRGFASAPEAAALLRDVSRTVFAHL